MNNILQNANISNYLNCWRVFLRNKAYAITPAHCLVYQKNNWHKSLISGKLDKYEDLKWKIPVKYTEKKDILYDFAFSEIDSSRALDCYNVHSDTSVKFYFYQPFTYSGQMGKEASLGRIDGVIYKSPDSDLFETIGIGFRGMSGALCINKNIGVVGMYIRRGEDLGIDRGHTYISQVTNGLSLSNLAISRGMIMPPKLMIKHIEGETIDLDDLVTTKR